MHLRFFFFLSWQSLPSTLMFLQPSSVPSTSHIYGIREQPCSHSLRKEDICGCGSFSGGGGRSINLRGRGQMKSMHTGILQQKLGEGSKDRLKNIHLLFPAIPPIGITFCWGDVCQGLLIQFVPPVLFLSPTADFIPGMLQDWCGQKWANLLQRCFITTWKRPSKMLQVHFRGDSHFLFLPKKTTLIF